MSSIHPTAIIADGAIIDPSATIGAYCIIGAHVTIEADVILHAHVNIDGHTRIGRGTEIYPFASIGTAPQDLKYGGEASRLEVGEYNRIREHVTMNTGTEGGGMLTKTGNHCLFMVGTHVAHDCIVGNHVILANNATLAGHVIVGDHAIIGGLSAIHQFVRIGEAAIIGGMSGVEKDVIPYGSVTGERAALSGLNLVGLKRKQTNRDTIHAIRHAFDDLFYGKDGSTLAERTAALRDKYQQPEVHAILDFLQADSHRSFCVPREA